MRVRFSAKVYKLGINPCVDVPKRISQAFGVRGYVPVAGTLNGQPIRATLVPKGSGRHRLYLNNEMRQRAEVAVGDRVTLVLRLDREPRTIPMPEAFAAALKKDKSAQAAFERLPPSRQKEVLAYLNWVKRPETLQRNIEKVMARLHEQAG